MANALLLFPSRIPLRQHDHRRPLFAFRAPPRRKELPVNSIVLRPRRSDLACKRQDVRVEFVVVRGRRRVPFIASCDRPIGELSKKSPRICITRAADMIESPRKRQRPAIRLLRPPLVLVPPYLLLEPSHGLRF